MIYPNADSALYIAESKKLDQVQRQKIALALSDTGIDQRGVFARSSARMLCLFGHQLVRLGRRLETYDLTTVSEVPQTLDRAIPAP